MKYPFELKGLHSLVKESAKDPSSFHDLYRRLYSPVMKSILRSDFFKSFSCTRFDAENLSQDVFMRIIEKCHLLKQHEDLHPMERDGATWSWIKKITTNITIDYCKEIGKRKEDMFSHLQGEHQVYDDLANYFPQLREFQKSSFEYDQLIKSFTKVLSPREMKVVNLKLTGGMTNKDIAKKLGVSSQRISQLLKRIQSKVQHLIQV